MYLQKVVLFSQTYFVLSKKRKKKIKFCFIYFYCLTYIITGFKLSGKKNSLFGVFLIVEAVISLSPESFGNSKTFLKEKTCNLQLLNLMKKHQYENCTFYLVLSHSDNLFFDFKL